MTVAVVLVGFVALVSDFFIRATFWGGRRDNGGRGGALMAIAAVIVVAIAIALMLNRAGKKIK